MKIKTFIFFALICVTGLAQTIPGRHIVELTGEPAAVYAAKRSIAPRAATDRLAQMAAE